MYSYSCQDINTTFNMFIVGNDIHCTEFRIGIGPIKAMFFFIMRFYNLLIIMCFVLFMLLKFYLYKWAMI